MNLLRWLLIGSIAFYFIPLFFYAVFFCTIKPMCEVIGGFLSFLFYTPTYLILLNTYSLCRIDDISWGTKGLDSRPKNSSKLQGAWSLIKFIHVGKFVIWNIIVASLLLTLGNNSLYRFWVTFGLVCIITATQAIKVIIGMFYMLYYKCVGPSLNTIPARPP